MDNNNNQILDQQQQSHSYYSSTSFFSQFAVSKFNPKKKTQQQTIVPLQDRINKIEYQLITQISIISPTRIRGMEFRKQLRNYRFGRVQKQRLSMFGTAQQELLREQQTITLTFLQIMKEFKRCQKHKFYLIVKKNDCVYNFFHDQEGKYSNEKGNSFCSVKGKGRRMSQFLKQQEIQFEMVNKEDSGDNQEFIIKNYEISILWGSLLNLLAINNTPFDIIANFSFMNACQDLPQQIFNGNQHNKNYQYIGIGKRNLLDQEIKEVFRLKLQGLWMYENMIKLMKQLQEKYKQNKFDIQMTVHKYSPDFKLYCNEQNEKE